MHVLGSSTVNVHAGMLGCALAHWKPLRRLGYINWLWYVWGAAMINQYEGSDVKIVGGIGVLEYYSLNGVSKWAFLVYASLTFVFFFAVCYVVGTPLVPLCCTNKVHAESTGQTAPAPSFTVGMSALCVACVM